MFYVCGVGKWVIVRTVNAERGLVHGKPNEENSRDLRKEQEER